MSGVLWWAALATAAPCLYVIGWTAVSIAKWVDTGEWE